MRTTMKPKLSAMSVKKRIVALAFALVFVLPVLQPLQPTAGLPLFNGGAGILDFQEPSELLINPEAPESALYEDDDIADLDVSLEPEASIAPFATTLYDDGSGIAGLPSQSVGAIVNIDGQEWIVVRHYFATSAQRYCTKLILNDVLYPHTNGVTYADTQAQWNWGNTYNSNPQIQMNVWYAGLSSPTLKKYALQPQLGVTPTESWIINNNPLQMAGNNTERIAFLPRKADLTPYLSTNILILTTPQNPASNSKIWWSDNTYNHPNYGLNYKEYLKADGTWGYRGYSDSIIFDPIYARPCIWVVGSSGSAPSSFTLGYSANSGIGAPPAQSGITPNTWATISNAQPTRDGYVFTGWATTNNATTAQYQPGGTIFMDGNKTLYAVWVFGGGLDDGTGLRLRSTVPGDKVTIDGIEWIVVRHDYMTAAQRYCTKLILNDVLYPHTNGVTYADTTAQWAGGDTYHSNPQIQMNGWYAGLNAPTLKKYALWPMLGTQPTESWILNNNTLKLAGNDTERIAFLPRQADVFPYLPTSKLLLLTPQNPASNSKLWWTDTTYTHPNYGKDYKVRLSSNGTWGYEYYATNIAYDPIYARPCIWVLASTSTGPSTVSITYESNGGTGSAVTDTVNPGTQYSIKSNMFSRSGHTFAGWNTAANGSGTSYSAGQIITASGSLLLYAQWNVIYVDITYYANNGTGMYVVDNVPMNSQYIIKSQPFTRPGYNFANWNTAANGSGTTYNVGQTITVTADLPLNAQWTATTADIIYNANGGIGSPVTDTVNINSQYTIRGAIFPRPGYTLSNWNTAANGSGTTYALGQTIFVTAGLTLHAQWSAVPTATVSYNSNGGVGPDMPQDTVPIGSQYTIRNSTYTRPNYTFTSWNTAANGSGTSYPPGSWIVVTGDLVLYAQWTSIIVNITYYPNGGTGTSVTDPVGINTQYTIKSQPFTRAGFTFTGWNTSVNGSGTAYTVGQMITVTANLPLFAQWTPVPTVTITYYPNEGIGPIIYDTVNQNSQYTVRGVIYSRPNYTFTGWNTAANGSGTPYSANQVITAAANLSLYAQWQAVSTVTITYTPNGGSGSNAEDTINAGSLYTIKSQPYTRTNFTFAGWNTAANGSGTSYSVGQTITVNSSLTLYAQWTQISVNIYYYPNGGTGTPAMDTANINSQYTIKSQPFTRPGHSFTGWNTAVNGSGTAYTVGQVITASANLTLFAQWTPVPTVTITYNPNGGLGSIAYDTVNQNSQYTIKSQPYSRINHTFTGWNTAANGSGTPYAVGQVITATANLSLYAQWQVGGVTMTYNPNGGIGSIFTENANLHSLYVIKSQSYTRTNHTFMGWNTEANGSGAPYAVGQAVFVTGGLTLYAQWRENAAILYVPNGGTGDPVADYGTAGVWTIKGSLFTPPTGLRFYGWGTSPDSLFILPEGMVINSLGGTLTLYAQWSPDIGITYEPNGGIGTQFTQYVDRNSDITIANNTFTRISHIFTFWNSTAAGNGDNYYQGVKLRLTHSLTLYAQWHYTGIE